MVSTSLFNKIELLLKEMLQPFALVFSQYFRRSERESLNPVMEYNVGCIVYRKSRTERNKRIN